MGGRTECCVLLEAQRQMLISLRHIPHEYLPLVSPVVYGADSFDHVVLMVEYASHRACDTWPRVTARSGVMCLLVAVVCSGLYPQQCRCSDEQQIANILKLQRIIVRVVSHETQDL